MNAWRALRADRLASVWRRAPRVARSDASTARERFVDQAMRRSVAAHPGDGHGAQSHPYDVVRLARTLDWLEQLEPHGRRILELGGYGIASYVIEQAFPDGAYVRTDADLRQPLPFPDEQFDLVLSMEVIEHVADLAYGHATVLSGARHCLREVRRVLRLGGHMLLTTPNACSLLVIDRALQLQPPSQYEFHFREFTPREIQILVEDAGLHVRRFATEFVWSRSQQRRALERFIRRHRLDSELRGDDMFLVAQKTATPPTPRGSLALPL